MGLDGRRQHSALRGRARPRPSDGRSRWRFRLAARKKRPAGGRSGPVMTPVRIGFLTRWFKPQTRSSVPLVMQALAEAGAIVDVIHPVAGMSDLSELRVQHDLYGVKREVERGTKAGQQREPFTPTPELSRIVLRCGAAFGIDLFGVDIIECDGAPYVVDMNSFPGFSGVRDGIARVARYLYQGAERAARGQQLFESPLPLETMWTAGLP